MDFKSILPMCQVTQSSITKTGEFYVYKGQIILEFIKSSKNVWVEETLAATISDKLKAEQDIKSFFGNAKNVYIDRGLPLIKSDNIKTLMNQMFATVSMG
jgi:hypothetical protein